jgi:putative SOS response-associated peptidase YedK
METDLLFSPRYNIAPTQKATVEIVENGRLIAKKMSWGFLPKWSKAPIINAQEETIATKPTFKTALVSQRCLIPADGFYEWKNDGGRKIPMRFVLGDGEPFYFAGIWDKFKKPVKPLDDLFAAAQPAEPTKVETFLILTTSANAIASPIHNRMPVILKPEMCDEWLDPNSSAEVLTYVLHHPRNDELRCFAVSPLVNNVRNESAECLNSI